MSSNEWGIIISICVSIAVPSTIGWVAVFIMLVSVKSELKHATSTIADLREQKAMVVQQVAIHEGRIESHDKLLGALIHKLEIPAEGA